MNLTPEQREIGKQNFAGAVEATRRDFLKGSLAAAAVGGAGLGAFYFGYTKVGDPVRIGVIGTGDEGGVLIGAHNPEYLNIVAISDIRPYNVHRAFHGDTASPPAKVMRPGLIEIYKWAGEDQARQQVKVYVDYKEMLDDPNIEGVVIATPLFLHDKIAIEAMHKGKHVLTEKLMAYSVGQCKDMGRISKQTKKLLATGHQRHYSILYDNAVATIQAGLLGDLHHIRAQWHRGNLPGKDSWAPKLPDQLAKELVDLQKKIADAEAKDKPDMKRLETLRKEMQLVELRLMDADVDAKKFGYQDKKAPDGSDVSALRELIHWRLWNRTGAGLMAELGSHQLDAAGIFCTAARKDKPKARPLSVVGVGGRHIFPGDREVDDHVYCTFEYPGRGFEDDPNKKIVVTYSSINGNAFGDWGEIVMGTEGTLILDKEQEAIIFKGGSPTSVTVAKGKDDKPVLEASPSAPAAVASTQKGGGGPISRGYTEEMEHWAWCIRNFDYEQNQPKCKPEVAMADAIIALTTNRAIREQKRIEFENDWFNIDSDDVPDGPAPTVKA